MLYYELNDMLQAKSAEPVPKAENADKKEVARDTSK